MVTSFLSLFIALSMLFLSTSAFSQDHALPGPIGQSRAYVGGMFPAGLPDVARRGGGLDLNVFQPLFQPTATIAERLIIGAVQGLPNTQVGQFFVGQVHSLIGNYSIEVATTGTLGSPGGGMWLVVSGERLVPLRMVWRSASATSRGRYPAETVTHPQATLENSLGAVTAGPSQICTESRETREANGQRIPSGHQTCRDGVWVITLEADLTRFQYATTEITTYREALQNIQASGRVAWDPRFNASILYHIALGESTGVYFQAEGSAGAGVLNSTVDRGRGTENDLNAAFNFSLSSSVTFAILNGAPSPSSETGERRQDELSNYHLIRLYGSIMPTVLPGQPDGVNPLTMGAQAGISYYTPGFWEGLRFMGNAQYHRVVSPGTVLGPVPAADFGEVGIGVTW